MLMNSWATLSALSPTTVTQSLLKSNTCVQIAGLSDKLQGVPISQHLSLPGTFATQRAPQPFGSQTFSRNRFPGEKPYCHCFSLKGDREIQHEGKFKPLAFLAFYKPKKTEFWTHSYC